MAVKKTAKKSTAKKAPAKKVAAKKAVAKKAVVKKAVAKKAVVKKAVAKKATVKKAVVNKEVVQKAPTKKVAAKKAVVKKAVAKKAVAKKAVVKKAVAKKSAAKRSSTRIVIPPVPTLTFSSLDSAPVISIDSTPKPASIVSTPAPSTPKEPGERPKSSSRVVLWVIIGVVLIAILVVARNHNSTATPATSATPTTSNTPVATPTDTSSTTPQSSATPSASATPASTPSDLAPVGIVAHYTATGAAIFWAAAKGSSGIATYNIEASSSGGPFKLIATVPATQLSLNVTETDNSGWTSFKISAVYTDGAIVPGKVFGLPGQYA